MCFCVSNIFEHNTLTRGHVYTHAQGKKERERERETCFDEGCVRSFQLFEHIAKCIEEFLVEHNLRHEKFQMGFTFSFPCIQVRASYILTYTKTWHVLSCICSILYQ